MTYNRYQTATIVANIIPMGLFWAFIACVCVCASLLCVSCSGVSCTWSISGQCLKISVHTQFVWSHDHMRDLSLSIHPF